MSCCITEKTVPAIFLILDVRQEGSSVTPLILVTLLTYQVHNSLSIRNQNVDLGQCIVHKRGNNKNGNNEDGR